LEQQKLQGEYDDVLARIAYLEDLLASPKKILAVIREDVQSITESYADARNTHIIFGSATVDESDLFKKEDVVISLSANGYIKRVPSTAYRAQRRGGKGVMGMQTKEEDVLRDIFYASSHDTVLFFSDKGKVYSEIAYRIPETGRANRGTLIQSVLPLGQDEAITAILPVTSFEQEGWYFVMATKHGRIKRVDLQEFSEVRPSGLIAINLNEDDYLGWVKYSNGEQDIVLVTESGQSIRFNENDVRAMGRTAGGVNAIKLADDDRVAGMDVITEEHSHVLVITTKGFGKRTRIEEYPVQSRYGLGVRTLARNPKIGVVAAMRVVKEDDELMLVTRSGVVLRTNLQSIRETGRATQGVIVMNCKGDDEVVGIAVMKAEDNGEIDADLIVEGAETTEAPADPSMNGASASDVDADQVDDADEA